LDHAALELGKDDLEKRLYGRCRGIQAMSRDPPRFIAIIMI
jgi:hypothetical protein